MGEQEQSAICWWVHLEVIVKLKSIINRVKLVKYSKQTD